MADIKRKRIEAAHSMDLARSRFRILLRLEDDEAPLLLTEELAWSPYERSLEECIALALGHHPGILLTQLAADKAERAVTLARSGFFPRVALVGALDHEEGGFVETEHRLSATVHADWTVWEWGSNYYKVQQNRSALLVARARNTQQVDAVKLQVRAAYLGLKEWQESIEVARASIEQAEENYRITVEQYNANVTTSTEVLDAQTLQAQAKVNYYTALSNYNVALARLQKAMGVLQKPGT
jgi:outer membrane protein TolC